MKTKRAYLTSPRHFDIVEKDITPADNQVLVKIKICGLCNWELNFWKGTGGPDSYYNSYKGVLGHEWAGTVVEAGKDVKKLKVGDKVTFLPGGEFGGFSEYSVFSEDECYKLDENVNLYDAMGEPLKCITTVITNTDAHVGDYGLIFGCGPMGLWCTMALKSNLLGNLIAVDVDDEKLEMAKKYGATHTINPLKEDAMARVEEITHGALCDFVIEGTGNVNLMPTVVKFLKDRGRLILMSSYEGTIPNFDMSEINAKCVKIIPSHPTSCVDQVDTMRRAVALIDRGVFQSHELISHKFKLDDINKAFETLEHKPKDYIKGIIEFD